MKKFLVLVLSVVACAAVALSLPADENPSPSDPPAVAEAVLVSTTETLPLATPLAAPEPIFADTVCTASLECPGGSQIQCSGSSSCVIGYYLINCDGTPINCPCVGSPCGPYCRCECLESGGTQRECTRECGFIACPPDP